MNFKTERRNELFTHFEKCVEKHFDFLRKSMSYSIEKNTMGWCVIYASDKVKINIFYERVSFEIYLTIAINGGTYCTIDEILKEGSKRNFLFATDENTLENAVIELKALVNLYVVPLINGDQKAYEIISENRKRHNKDYNSVLIAEKADIAWKNGNYDDVVKLYQSIKDHLTLIQKKRLCYSLKKIGLFNNES